MNSDLVFLKYIDSNEGEVGLVFFYPGRNETWLLESDDSHKVQVEAVDSLEEAISKFIYMTHKKSTPQGDAWKQYCMPASPELIYQSKDLYFIIEDEEETKVSDPIEKQTT